MADSGIEVLPGTEVMTDLDGAHFVHAHNSTDSAVLVPQPSNDANDPLNWSPRWKYTVIASQAAFVFVSQIGTLSIAPLMPIYMKEWNKGLAPVALLTGATVLALGYTNFVIIPCSDVFGRRIVLLICAAISLGSYIWQALATSYGSFLGARVLNGIGAASNESIMTVVIADIFFLHERGKWMGIYFALYNGGTYIGPIISGAIGERTSWRWFFWACMIAQAVVLVILFLTFPETRRIGYVGKSLSRSPEIQSSGEDVTEKGVKPRTASSQSSIEAETMRGKGKPRRSQFGFIQKADRQALRHVFRHIVTPFQIFFFPIIGWAALTFGFASDSLLLINLFQSQAFAAPPYNFSSQSVGFTNFSLLIGNMVAMAIAGPWSDWVAMRATKKNNGVREPEMRLLALLPFVGMYALSMTISGVGWQHGWPWEAVVVLAFPLIGCACTAIMALTITYAVDCYKPVAGQIMVVSTVIKNTFGFGMTYWVNDMAAAIGYITPHMILLALDTGLALFGIFFFVYFGRSMRRLTKSAAVHSFE